MANRIKLTNAVISKGGIKPDILAFGGKSEAKQEWERNLAIPQTSPWDEKNQVFLKIGRNSDLTLDQRVIDLSFLPEADLLEVKIASYDLNNEDEIHSDTEDFNPELEDKPSYIDIYYVKREMVERMNSSNEYKGDTDLSRIE